MPLPTSMKPVCVFGTNLRFLVRRKLFLLNFFQTVWHLKLLKNNHILFSSLGGKLDKFFSKHLRSNCLRTSSLKIAKKSYIIFLNRAGGVMIFGVTEMCFDFIGGMGEVKLFFCMEGGTKISY